MSCAAGLRTRPLPLGDDCKDAGGRAMQEQLPRGGVREMTLFRLHANGAIETDSLAIQHHAFANLLHQLRVFLGLAEA
jgi:hypothetical protein